jgi:two-component system response regulator HydG
MRLLLGYNYSGNVRELENIIESSVVLCSGETITPEDLPSALREGGSAEEDLVMRPGMPLREVERLHVIETLRYTKGNKRRAAELLGITRQAIYRKIEQYKITPDWQQKGGPGRAA